VGPRARPGEAVLEVLEAGGCSQSRASQTNARLTDDAKLNAWIRVAVPHPSVKRCWKAGASRNPGEAPPCRRNAAWCPSRAPARAGRLDRPLGGS